MSLVPPIKDGDFTSIRQAIQLLASNLRLGYQSVPIFGGADINGNVDISGNNVVGGNSTIGGTLGVTGLSTLGDVSISGTITFAGLTASRLVATNADLEIVSSDLFGWVTGTTNQVTVTDDTDGTVTLSLPQDIATTSSPTFAAITATSATGLTLGTDAATNIAGYMKLWSAGANAFYTTIVTGTQTANATYILPVAMPAGNSYPLICSTAGVLGWNDQAVLTTSIPQFAGLTVNGLTLSPVNINLDNQQNPQIIFKNQNDEGNLNTIELLFQKYFNPVTLKSALEISVGGYDDDYAESKIIIRTLEEGVLYDTFTIDKKSLTSLGNITAYKFISSVTGGTSPYACTSTVLNTNLNADLLDGQHASAFYKSGDSPSFGAITGTSLALGAGSITMTGSLGSTGSRVTKGWFTDLECTNAIVGGLISLSTSSGVLIKNYNGVTVASFGVGAADSLNVALLGNTVNTGTFSATTITGTSFVIGANTLNGTEWGYLDGQDQSVFTTSAPQFARLGIGTAAVTTRGLMMTFVGPAAIGNVVGADITGRRTNNGVTGANYVYGINFGGSYQPTVGGSGRTLTLLSGGFAANDFALATTEDKNYTIATYVGYRTAMSITGSTTGGGIATAANNYQFGAYNTIKVNANAAIGTQIAFYDDGMTTGTANYGLAINTKSYINGNLLLGSAGLASESVVIADDTALGSEVLTNGDFTGGTSWTAAGDFAYNTNKFTYTHSAGSGTLTQASGDFAVAAVGSRYYKFTYTISTVTPVASATITTSFAATAVNLVTEYAGTYSIVFKSAAVPSDFVISATSTASGGIFTIDTISLKEVQDGDLYICDDLTVMGSSTLTGGISLPAGSNIALATTTGTKIGTATNQLLGFYNATPVDQPATVADAATQDIAGADTVDEVKVEADLTSCKNAINAIISRLKELGLIAT